MTQRGQRAYSAVMADTDTPPTPEEEAAWEAAVQEIMARDGVTAEVASLRLGNLLLNLEVKRLRAELAKCVEANAELVSLLDQCHASTVRLQRDLDTARAEVARLGAALAKCEAGTVTPPPPPPPPSSEFYIKNGRIGRSGKQWVPIGLNGVPTARSAPPGDWWNDTGMGVMNGKSKMFVDLGFNMVRLTEMRDLNSYSYRDFMDGMFDTIDEYTARGVVCMPSYHAAGPGTNPTPAQLRANGDFNAFWGDIIGRYKTNPLVWVNPLNEPIGGAWDQWEALATYQYDLIRALGHKGIIVVDLPQWAQGIGFAPDRAAPWAVNGGRYGVALGFHNYGMGWQSDAVRATQARGVPVIVGECGATLGEVTTSSYDWCIAEADNLGTGALFWWGAGNRNDDYVLRNRRGSTFYDTSVPTSVAGAKMFSLAANRPVQPAL